MSIIENAISQMEKWANDDSHGYDQADRWGPDYDCSSAVIQAWENAGVPVKSAGATYTGNMYSVFTSHGFIDVTNDVDIYSGSGLERGDVLLNTAHHTAMYCGDGQIVQASINEYGTVTGGQTGDQTGREFYIRGYYNYPWDYVLRFSGDISSSPSTIISESLKRNIPVNLPTIQENDVDVSVAVLQAALKMYGLDPTWIDGEFGPRTTTMVKKFQANNGLEVDGIVGKATWTKLLKN